MTRRLYFQKLLHEVVGEGATLFPGLLHFTIDPYFMMLSVKQNGIKYHFFNLWYDSTTDEHCTHFQTQHHKARIKGMWSNPEKGITLSSTPLCCSCWKGSLRFALDYGRPTNIYIYIYIYMQNLKQITWKGWYAIKYNQTNLSILSIFTKHSARAGYDTRSIF